MKSNSSAVSAPPRRIGASRLKRNILVGALLAAPLPALACASCGCTLSSDWASMGYSAAPGLQTDIRYDYLDQNQLRSGRNTISPQAASQIVTNGNNQEVEKYTRNQYWTLGADYVFNPNWRLSVQVPITDRAHSTLGTQSDGSTAGPGGGQYDSKYTSLGDVKVIGRYQGFTEQHNFGILFGLKLPTGSHTLTGTSTDPTAPGPVPIDRGLQPGSGTTDVILGAYYFDTLSKNWDYFAQGIFQAATDSKDQYRPGNNVTLTAGLRYMGFEGFTPLLQVNARNVVHDGGINSDPVSTGGTLVYISPGVVVPLGQRASVYGFVQLPVYQNVNGVQLAPRYTASIGLHYSF